MMDSSKRFPTRSAVADPQGEAQGVCEQPLASIILLNWNHWQETLECLDSLQSLDYANFETIVVDNGSTNDSTVQIQSHFPAITLIRAQHNLGFAGGCNLGIREAIRRKSEYIWLLNNDTKVHPSALTALVETAESDPKIGAVGSAIYFMADPGRLQSWGGGYVRFWLGCSRHFDSPVPDSQIEYLTGASMLIPKHVLETVGLLDERYFMYWEDTDFCFRLRNGGWRLAVASGSTIWHKGSATVGSKSALLDCYVSASALQFFRTHSPLPWFSCWIGLAARLGARAAVGDWKRVKAVWSTVRQGQPPRERTAG
jgi:GT2 family glycosyltransferase